MDGESDLLTAGKIAAELGVSAAKVSKFLKENGIEPDAKRGNCGYYGQEKVERVKEGLKKPR